MIARVPRATNSRLPRFAEPLPLCRRLFPAWLMLVGAETSVLASKEAPEPVAPPVEKRVRDYAPGVRIDWSNRRVELEAEVALRKGPLELFACSPQTREHESIFVVRARPLHFYQAMGLLGWEPGKPVRYDKDRREWLPPTGAPLAISVRCGSADAEAVPAHRLMRPTDPDQKLDDIPWVFSGSMRLEGGKFGADFEGTVICVVDFETALITIGALHSSNNEQLWLQANTEAIPPVGTACTILIASTRAP